ncbi:MAG: baseplate J/gp47 family protein [Candidatus Gastranaerophilales bacterium]|nr:baseplate J/gp47 family protein [Candidatus Gastranaerophilales bacterium]
MTTTKEELQESINSRLTSLPTTIEGGTTQDIIGSVSYELANIIDTQIDVILDNAFITTADEEHLILRGEELGITKKEATYAKVAALITNAASNLTISTNVRAQTESGIIFKVTEETTADETGSASVIMECLESGSSGNISIGELNEFYTSYTGLTGASITNEASGYDGYDEEDVEDYRERILEYLQNGACNSNVADYVAWAKSVSGVKNVVVLDAFSAGAGNVWVYISALNNESVSDDLINEVKELIESEQIVNANVSVFALEYYEINVSATLTLEDGADISEIISDFEETLENYLDTLPSPVSYLYISNLLFEVEGVTDVSNYFLNEQTSSVTRTSLQIPVIGEINLSEE